MKINYKNTCLHFLDNPRKIGFHIPANNKGLSEEEELSFGRSVRSAFADLATLDSEPRPFRQKIRLLSRPFLEAYEKGKSKLSGVFDKEPIEETGTFITQLGSFTNTYFYYIKTSGIGDEWRMDWTLIVFTKNAQAELPGLDVCLHEIGGHTKTFIFKDWEENGMDKTFWMTWLVTLICFIKYCPLETKIVNGGRREHHAGQKYVNETGHAIEILDSTWFTTITRSEGFNVGGHFRLQPWGPGMTQRRLQWIEPFEKTGYTRKARIAP